MARDQHDTLCIVRIGAFQDCIDIGNLGGLRNTISGRLGEAVGLYFETAATFR